MNKLKTKLHIWWLQIRIKRLLVVHGLVQPVAKNRLLHIRALWTPLLMRFGANPRQRFSRFAHATMVVILLLSILPAFLFSGLFSGTARAASQGPRSATASTDCVNNTDVGGVAWTSPGNAFSSNDSHATASLATGNYSNYILCTNYGFTLPTNSNIKGITASVERKAGTASRIFDLYIKIVKNGSTGNPVLDNKANGTAWPTADTVINYGSISDLWGETWTPSDINASNFGIAISATKSGGGGAVLASVDHVTLTVEYEIFTLLEQSSYRWFENQDSPTSQLTYLKNWGSTGTEDARDSVIDSAGNIIFTGYTSSYGTGGDIYAMKVNSLGEIQWMRTWGGTGQDIGYGVAVDTSNNVIVTGQLSNATDSDLFITKFDSSGAELWTKTWGLAGDSLKSDYGYDVMVDTAGNYVVSGYTLSYGSSTQCLMVKFNTSGLEQWSSHWGGANSEECKSIVGDSSNNYYTTGHTASFTGEYDVLLSKINVSGVEQWTKTWGADGTGENGEDVRLDSNGNIIVAGLTAGYGAGGNDAFLTQFNSSGIEQWTKTLGTTSEDEGLGLTIDASNNYIVTGRTNYYGAQYDIFLAKFNSSGVEQWTKTWGGSSFDYGYSVNIDSSGNFITTGSMNNTGAGAGEIMLAKLDSTGLIANCSSCVTRDLAEADQPTIGETDRAFTSTAITITEADLPTTPSSQTPTVTIICDYTAIDVGSPLNSVAQNTATTTPAEQVIFRLRMLLHASTASAADVMKLQYAPRGSDNLCDTSFSNETYADVTTSTPIAYANNTNATDGMLLVANANDPAHSGHTVIKQEYNEANNTSIVKPIASGQDGMWDFALKDNGAPATSVYCFRMVFSTGTLLDTYSVVPQVITAPPYFDQANYRWYKGQDATPNNTFAQAWGGTGADEAFSVVQTTDGGYAATGDTVSYGAGNGDVYLAKYDSTGALSWSKTWGSVASDEVGWDIIQTADGGYAITGYTDAYGGGGIDAFILKYDASGTLSWNRMWGGNGSEYAYELAQGTHGGIGIVGYTTTYTVGADDAFLAVFNQDGSLAYSRTWGSAGGEVGSAIVATADGGFAIAGDTSIGPGTFDAFIVRFNDRGERMWDKTWGVSGSDAAYGLTQLTDGSFVMAGDNYGDGDAFLVKFADDGTVLWDKTWGGVGADSMFSGSVSPTADGGILLSGQTDSYGAGLDDIYLAKFTSAGALSWSKTWGGTGIDYPGGAKQTSDGGYVVAGHTESYGEGSADMILLKYNDAAVISGCSTTMCQSPSATSATASGTVTTANGTVNSPSATNSSPSANVSSPTATVIVVAGHMSLALYAGGTFADSARKVVQLPNGNLASCGSTQNWGGGSYDLLLLIYEPNGNIVTQKTLGSTGQDMCYDLILTADGSLVITGSQFSYSAGSSDLWIAKFNSAGVEQWTTTAGGTGGEAGRSVIQTQDGGYVVYGDATTYSGTDDGWLTKYNSSGVMLWMKTFSWGGQENGYDVVETSAGDLVIVGSTNGTISAGGFDAYITKVNSTGIEQWTKTMGDIDDDAFRAIRHTADGGFIVSGDSASFGTGDDVWVVKFDQNGAEVWTKTFGADTLTDQSYDLAIDADGGYLISAATYSYGAGQSDMIIIKLNNKGIEQWTKTIGGTGLEEALGITQSDTYGILATGTTQSYGAGGTESMVVSVGRNGETPSCGLCAYQTISETNRDIGETNRLVGETNQTVAYTARLITEANQTTVNESYYATPAIWGETVPVPGVAIGAQDTAGVSVRHDDPLRLRFTLEALSGGKQAIIASVNAKLQVAPRVGTCDTSFTGESYIDLSGSTAFNFYDNTNIINDTWAHRGSSDPTVGASNLWYENYQETAGFTNRHYIATGDYGLWDISLTPTDEAVYNSYCFRVVNNDNSLLNTYTQVFELNIPPAASQQMRHGKFFDTTETAQPFYW